MTNNWLIIHGLPRSNAAYTETIKADTWKSFPILTDAAEAIMFYEANPSAWSSNLMKAWIVRHLVEDGYANADIRDALKIRKKYVVTHLIRVGKSLSLEEFDLWAQYPASITFGHMRAIASLPYPTRRDLLRLLLKTKTTVSQLETIARGRSSTMKRTFASLRETSLIILASQPESGSTIEKNRDR